MVTNDKPADEPSDKGLALIERDAIENTGSAAAGRRALYGAGRAYSYSEIEALKAELAHLRAESMRGANVCWHCKVCLLPQRQRCETCPEECDNEDCQAEGCIEQQSATPKPDH